MKRRLCWHSDILTQIHQLLIGDIKHTFQDGPTQDVLPNLQTWKVTVVTHEDKHTPSAHAVLISWGSGQGTSHLHLMGIVLWIPWQFGDSTEDVDGETPHRIRGRVPISVWMKHIACSSRNALLVEFVQLECIDCIFHSNYIIAGLKGDLLHMVFKVGTDPIWYSLLPTWLYLRKQTDTFQREVSSPVSSYFQVYQSRPCTFTSIANIFWINLLPFWTIWTLL